MLGIEEDLPVGWDIRGKGAFFGSSMERLGKRCWFVHQSVPVQSNLFAQWDGDLGSSLGMIKLERSFLLHILCNAEIWKT